MDFDFLKIKYAKSSLYEEARRRMDFKEYVDNFAQQILEIWVLIRYCTISGYSDELKLHWQGELLNNYLKKLREEEIKKNKDPRVKEGVMFEVFEDWNDFDKNIESLRKRIKKKIEKEGLKMNQNMLQATADFSEYGYKDIAKHVAYGNNEQLWNYVYFQI